MVEDLIKTVEKLLASGRGNVDELEFILKLLKEKRPLPRFDRVYLEKLLAKKTRGYRGSTKYKSEGTSLVLSLFFGAIGFMGIGHRYVGTIWKSLAILYGGWVLSILSYLAWGILLLQSVIKTVNPEYQSYYYGSPLASVPYGLFNNTLPSQIYTITFFIVIPIGYLALYIWQIFDARNETRKFNDFMDRIGQELYEITLEKKIAYVLIFCAPIIFATISLLVIYFITKH